LLKEGNFSAKGVCAHYQENPGEESGGRQGAAHFADSLLVIALR